LSLDRESEREENERLRAAVRSLADALDWVSDGVLGDYAVNMRLRALVTEARELLRAADLRRAG
jgi:hypothetical protein